MKKRSDQKKATIATVLEMICSLLTLAAALAFLSREIVTAAGDASEVSKMSVDTRELRVLLAFVFFMMALTRLFRARRFRLTGRPKILRIKNLIYAGLYLIGSFLPVFMRYTQGIGIDALINAETRPLFVGDVRQPLALIFWLSFLIGRIVSVIQNHKPRNLIPNVILSILIILYAYIAFAACEMMMAMIVILLQTMGAIFAVAFGRIHLDTLRKIIRKTYAMEIIMVLLLLICAFSYVFEYTEPAMPSFTDGLWYCFAIVTTIGFGDITAVSLIGRILSVILGIYGIIVVALITSIIVNFYGEVKKEPDDEPDREPGKKNEPETVPDSMLTEGEEP